MLLLQAVSLAALAASVSAGKTCTVKYSGGDDSANIKAAFKSCSKDATVVFDKKYTYKFYTPIMTEGLKNVKILVEGNIDLPNSIPDIQRAINTTANPKTVYATPWWYIQGDKVSLIGSKDKNKGWFDGHGEQWWAVNNKTLRPQIGTFNVTNGLIQDQKIRFPVAWGWHVPGKNIKIKDHYVWAKPTNIQGSRDATPGFPFNTDGFNIAGENIEIDGYWGVNGDDCVSIVNGAKNVVAKNGYCGFASHGLSIGSLGRDGAAHYVSDVLIENWVMEGAVYGARFKSWTGGRGLGKNIKWKNIKVYNVSTPIFVTQNYYDQDKGKPTNTANTSTHIDGLTFENFEGYINPNWTDGTCISDPCWNYLPGIDNTKGIIFDLYNGTAVNLQVKNLKVHPLNKPASATTVICDPLTLAPGEQDTLGFECVRGPFKVTKIKKN
ncbi:hypothetical protein FRC03_001121 [Tulasnella sp. 419]|nr:hypothetical protein FRC02_005836 [Tulasnella sp. 418]KAG8964970.1 hypothetical protein FRC03_001121 [Tulasnella sp. 419]